MYLQHTLKLNFQFIQISNIQLALKCDCICHKSTAEVHSYAIPLQIYLLVHFFNKYNKCIYNLVPDIIVCTQRPETKTLQFLININLQTGHSVIKHMKFLQYSNKDHYRAVNRLFSVHHWKLNWCKSKFIKFWFFYLQQYSLRFRFPERRLTPGFWVYTKASDAEASEWKKRVACKAE